MKPISDFKNQKVNIVLTDIDGTLTAEGRIPVASYEAMWKLYQSGIKVIPVTGRPAGWCEMIARTWPVHGVVGENGGLYFSLQNSRMKRFYAVDPKIFKKNRASLKAIRKEVLEKVPEARIASDQFCRKFDLAVDFAEDVSRLSLKQINKIVEIFRAHGAQAKVSNIHVNGWFGDYDKLSTCRMYLENEFRLKEESMKSHCAFIGDSPNDEPMFGFFPNSVAVANVKEFLPSMKSKPAYVCSKTEAEGFAEFVQVLLTV
jgi:HAD superfamily hydrolase (TIGR01484 family)